MKGEKRSDSSEETATLRDYAGAFFSAFGFDPNKKSRTNSLARQISLIDRTKMDAKKANSPLGYAMLALMQDQAGLSAEKSGNFREARRLYSEAAKSYKNALDLREEDYVGAQIDGSSVDLHTQLVSGDDYFDLIKKENQKVSRVGRIVALHKTTENLNPISRYLIRKIKGTHVLIAFLVSIALFIPRMTGAVVGVSFKLSLMSLIMAGITIFLLYIYSIKRKLSRNG